MPFAGDHNNTFGLRLLGICSRVLSAHIFLAVGLEFLSTSYAGPRAEPSLRDEPVRSVRNIRVKNSNQFYTARKTRDGHPLWIPSIIIWFALNS